MYQLHTLSAAQTKLWLLDPGARNEMAAMLAKKYPGGVGVLSDTKLLMALVDPLGILQELEPTYRRYQEGPIADLLRECLQPDAEPTPEAAVRGRIRRGRLRAHSLQRTQTRTGDWIRDALDDLPEILTTEEATGVLRISRRHLYRLIELGRIHRLRHRVSGSSRLMIPKVELEKYLRSLDVR